MEISVTQRIVIKWRLKDYPSYGISKDKELWNIRRGNKLKKTVIGTTIGYCIAGKFMSLKKINQIAEIVRDEYCPF